MKEKIYSVINTYHESENNRIHEYDIIEKINGEGHHIISLYKSKNETWSKDERGKNVITLIDTGNGMIFPKKEFINDVDYLKVAELYILFSFINKTKTNIYTGDIQQIEITNTYEI